MNKLRLGILGQSDGNGHPYSWSAIFNGYDHVAIKECGFQSIIDYLGRQIFPRDSISDATVTHIWTQNRLLSRRIADAVFIENIVDHPEDMIGEVDAILLARDDSENHRKYSEAFISVGLPIYVDKPLALSRREAINFFKLEVRPGQIFSCSALKFSREMLLTAEQLESLGKIKHISAQVPNSWNKYAIHAIDPILVNCGSLGLLGNIKKQKSTVNNDKVNLTFNWGDGAQSCQIRSLGEPFSPIIVDYHGSKNQIRTQFCNSFEAFKSSLKVFIEDSVLNQNSHSASILDAIKVLELGV